MSKKFYTLREKIDAKIEARYGFDASFQLFFPDKNSFILDYKDQEFNMIFCEGFDEMLKYLDKELSPDDIDHSKNPLPYPINRIDLDGTFRDSDRYLNNIIHDNFLIENNVIDEQQFKCCWTCKYYHSWEDLYCMFSGMYVSTSPLGICDQYTPKH